MPRRRRRSRRPAARPVVRRGSLRGSPQVRLRVGFVLIAMVLSLFGARLVQLQGLDPGSYAAMAAAEGTVDVVLPAERGDILDRNGEPLAASIDGLMVVGDPKMTEDQAPEIARFLAERLDVDYFTVLKRLRDEGQPVRVPRPPRPLDAGQRRAAGGRGPRARGARPCVATRSAPTRPTTSPPTWSASSAPTRPSAASRRSSTRRSPARTAARSTRSAPATGSRSATTPRSRPSTAQDLHTTIDRDLQWYTQRVLRQAVEESGGQSGIAVVMDSRTGEVLALADDPTFDADDPAASPVRDRRARSLNLSYEPGSVEKVLTLSALIDTGKVTARTKMLVPGQLRRQDRVIHDHWEHGLIKLTLAGVLAKSSNVGTVLAADKFEPGELRSLPRQVRPRPAHRTSASAPSRAASCPTRASGPTRPRTGSPSASRSRSTPCRWPPRSTPSPTTASASTRP